jgi:hypothetical protein
MTLYVPSTLEGKGIIRAADAVGELVMMEHGPAAGDAPDDVDAAPMAGFAFTEAFDLLKSAER